MSVDERQSDPTLEIARLGVDAETFLNTRLGIYLIERADFEIETNLFDLVEVSPDDIKMNTEIRNKINVARMFKNWINEVVQSGRLAVEELEASEAVD